MCKIASVAFVHFKIERVYTVMEFCPRYEIEAYLVLL